MPDASAAGRRRDSTRWPPPMATFWPSALPHAEGRGGDRRPSPRAAGQPGPGGSRPPAGRGIATHRLGNQLLGAIEIVGPPGRSGPTDRDLGPPRAGPPGPAAGSPISTSGKRDAAVDLGQLHHRAASSSLLPSDRSAGRFHAERSAAPRGPSTPNSRPSRRRSPGTVAHQHGVAVAPQRGSGWDRLRCPSSQFARPRANRPRRVRRMPAMQPTCRPSGRAVFDHACPPVRPASARSIPLVDPRADPVAEHRSPLATRLETSCSNCSGPIALARLVPSPTQHDGAGGL